MTAIDCRLGPRLWNLRSEGASVRASMATRKTLSGDIPVYTVTLTLKSGREQTAEGRTAQEAVDAMERIIGGEG